MWQVHVQGLGVVGLSGISESHCRRLLDSGGGETSASVGERSGNGGGETGRGDGRGSATLTGGMVIGGGACFFLALFISRY